MAPFFVIENFLEYLKSEKRYSEHTLIAYRKDVEQFMEFASVTSKEDLQVVNHGLVRSWLVDLMDNNFSEVSAHRKLSSLRTFFNWLRKNEIVDKNPVKLVKGPKKKKRLPSFAQQNEIAFSKTESLFSDDFNGIRDKFMFELLYQTGIRLSELINLKVTDINSVQIKVLGKRNKERIIPVAPALFDLACMYLKQRVNCNPLDENLFILENGKKIYPKLVYRKINDYLGKSTGLKKRSPHVLRHTFATHMLNNGAGLEILKELLGHANLTATQVYTHNSFKELTSIYSQSHPRGH